MFLPIRSGQSGRRAALEMIDGIRWGAVGALLTVAMAIMGSPGPTTVSLVGVASAFGMRGALPYMTGEILGTTAVLLAVALGVTAMLLAAPALGTALMAVSVAYVLWLAYHIATAPPLSSEGQETSPPSLGGGLLLGVANPKAWVAIAAVFASTQLVEDAAADAALKTAILTVTIVAIHVAWLLAGASIAPLLRHPRRARVLNIGMAAALVAATALAFLP